MSPQIQWWRGAKKTLFNWGGNQTRTKKLPGRRRKARGRGEGINEEICRGKSININMQQTGPKMFFFPLLEKARSGQGTKKKEEKTPRKRKKKRKKTQKKTNSYTRVRTLLI